MLGIIIVALFKMKIMLMVTIKAASLLLALYKLHFCAGSRRHENFDTNTMKVPPSWLPMKFDVIEFAEFVRSGITANVRLTLKQSFMQATINGEYCKSSVNINSVNHAHHSSPA